MIDNKYIYNVFSEVVLPKDYTILQALTETEEDFEKQNDMGKELSAAQNALLYFYGLIYIKVSGYDDSIYIEEKQKILLYKLYVQPGTADYIDWSLNKNRIDYIKRESKDMLLLYIFEIDDVIARFAVDTIFLALQAADIVEYNSEKSIIYNLKSDEYEHPDDNGTLNALKNNKAIQPLLNLIMEYDVERFYTLQYTSSAIEVTENNMPYIYNALKKVCEILNVSKIPKLYIQQGFINAYTVGAENPIIVLNSGCLSLLNYNELLFIIGHEVGHIKSLHQKYHLVGQILPYVTSVISSATLGLGELFGTGIQILMYKWYRKSELTADRAGLLACQSIDDAISLVMKLAGYPPKYYSNIDKESFRKQYENFVELNKNTFNKVTNLLAIAFNNHPLNVERVAELEKWMTEGGYDRILHNRVETTNDNYISFYFKYCSSCGNLIQESGKFCPHCGVRYTTF